MQILNITRAKRNSLTRKDYLNCDTFGEETILYQQHLNNCTTSDDFYYSDDIFFELEEDFLLRNYLKNYHFRYDGKNGKCWAKFLCKQNMKLVF